MNGERWDQVGALFSKAVEMPPHERAGFLAHIGACDPDLRGELESLLAAHANAGEGFLDQLDSRLARLVDEQDVRQRVEPWPGFDALAGTAPERTAPAPRPHRPGLATVVAILSILSGLGVALWQGRLAARERDLARQKAAQTEQVKRFIVELFSATERSDQQGIELTAEGLLARGRQRIWADLGGQPELQIELLTVIGDATALLGDHEGARSLFAEALALDTGDPPIPDRLLIAAALDGLGETSAYLGDDEIAEEHHRRALAIRREFAGPESRLTAESYNHLGVALARQRKLHEAVEMYRRSLDILAKIAGQDDPATLETLSNLGTAQRLQGDYLEAERLLAAVVERMTERQQERYPEMVAYQSELAAIRKRLGQFRQAEQLLRQSLELARDLWGESHPETRMTMNDYAMLAHDLGDDIAAEALMRKTLHDDLEQYGPEHTYIAIDRDNLGKVLLELGRVEEALAQFELAEDLHTLWSTLPTLAVHQVHHARARLAAGEVEHARRLIDRALASERRRGEPSPEVLAAVLTTSALVRMALGLDTEAAAQLEETLAIYERLGTPQHPTTGVALFTLGELCLAQGNLDEARSYLERAADIWTASLPATHWRLAELQVALGEHWVRLGSGERGWRLLDEGIAQLSSLRGEQHWRTRAAIERRESLRGGAHAR